MFTLVGHEKGLTAHLQTLISILDCWRDPYLKDFRYFVHHSYAASSLILVTTSSLQASIFEREENLLHETLLGLVSNFRDFKMLNVPPASELLSKPEKLQRGEFQFLLRQAQYNEVLLDAAELKRRIRFHPNSVSPASTPKTGVVDAGVISTLPAEGIINILRHTTISTLLTLRRANSTIKSIIDQ